MSSLENGLRILGLIEDDRPILRVTEVSETLGLPKATVSRTMRALCDAELLERQPTGAGYGVGRRVVDMSRHYFAQHSCLDEVDNLLRDLVKLHGFTGHAGKLVEGERVLLIARQGWYPLQHAAKVAERKFAFDSIIGQAILARNTDQEAFRLLGLRNAHRMVHGIDQRQVSESLAQIRQKGFARADSLKTPGISSIGSAVADPASGEVIGFCLSFPTSAVDDDLMKTIGMDVFVRARGLGLKFNDPFWQSFERSA